MALKEIYRETDPKPYRGIEESKFSPIDCERCGDLTVRTAARQKYCEPCGNEVKIEKSRESHSKPEAMQKNRERNRLRRQGLGGKIERKREETIPQKPSRAAEELNREMELAARVIKAPVTVFKIGESEIPVEFSPGDDTKTVPHFHIRQGKAELPLSARDMGEYGYERVMRDLKRKVPSKINGSGPHFAIHFAKASRIKKASRG